MLFGIISMLFEGIFMVSFVTNSFPPQLSAEEEEECLRRFEAGDDSAKNILIEHNLRLVAHVVKKYSGCGIESDDLISIGTIGLIKAITTYKIDKKIKLATYAARCIENEVLMVLRAGKKTQNEVSLSEPIGFDKEGNEVSFLDILWCEDDDVIDKIEVKRKIEKLYSGIKNCLKKREAEIIKKRYGLFGYNEKTQREIAKEMGISRSYVSRIEKKALLKLKAGFQLKE